MYLKIIIYSRSLSDGVIIYFHNPHVNRIIKCTASIDDDYIIYADGKEVQLMHNLFEETTFFHLLLKHIRMLKMVSYVSVN